MTTRRPSNMWYLQLKRLNGDTAMQWKIFRSKNNDMDEAKNC